MKKVSPKKHIFVSQQFSKEFLFGLFEEAEFMRENKYNVGDVLKNKIVTLLFYEPSTRLSFESSVLRLGGKCMTMENATQSSSATKGETIEDTIEMINQYSDFVIMRHRDDNFLDSVISKIKIPFINAGSGKTHHPTQTLLDVYTIYKNFNRLENLKICICGDLFRTRTVDGLVDILSKFDNNEFCFVSPDNSKIKPTLRKYLEDKEIPFREIQYMEEGLKNCDIFYITRVQKERFDSLEEFEKAIGKFILTKDNVELMKDNSIVLSPLPRIDEITIDVDENKRAKYFQQAENGLYIRMALLKILNENL